MIAVEFGLEIGEWRRMGVRILSQYRDLPIPSKVLPYPPLEGFHYSFPITYYTVEKELREKKQFQCQLQVAGLGCL